jgi:hypothetical protein
LYKKNTGKILIVGVLDVIGSTNISMAEGFRSLGYEVEAYNYRTKLEQLGYEGMHQDFDSVVSTETFDLVVFCKVNQMEPFMLDRAKKAGPTWYWFMDNFATCRQMNAAGYASNATYASATASDVAERFSMINNNAYHIFEGFDPKAYYKEDLKKIHDYLFIGNATVPRIIKIQELIRKGMNISIFGYGWPVGMQVNPPVFGEDERTEINSSKIVLNLCHDNVIFSDRVTKALACGANVLSQNCKDLREMAKWFTDNPAQQADIENTDAEWIAIVSDRKNIEALGYSMMINVESVDKFMKANHSWESVASKLIEKGVVCESNVR